MKFGILTALWGLLTVGVFWRFEGSYILPKAAKNHKKSMSLSDRTYKTLDLSETRGTIVLVNFWNPNCACSEFAEAHVRKLATRFGSRGVTFVSVIVGEQRGAIAKAKAHAIPGRLVLDSGEAICQEIQIPAAPAAVVFDRSGKVVYRGSYNIARFCDDQATAYVEKTLDALIDGHGEVPKGLPFYGCSTSVAK